MDFILKGTEDGKPVIPYTYDVKAGTAASLKPGDLAVWDATNAGYIAKMTASDTATTAREVFYVVGDSNETASADGTVQVVTAKRMILEGVAHTKANLVQAIIGTRVIISGTTTLLIDENATTNGFLQVRRPDGGASKFDTTNGVFEVTANL